MAGRKQLFKADDPFDLARRWLDEAAKTEPNDPNAAALATVDAQGRPDVRVVLIKAIHDDAVVFFTNYESRKGEEIAANPWAAVNFHWKTLRRQVRIRGRVERASAEESDAYYASRALGSRIGAWASQQSRPLSSKAALLKEVAKAQIKHGANPQRPPFWGGFRIVPFEFEFWADGEFRLHDRFRWSLREDAGGWDVQRLNP